MFDLQTNFGNVNARGTVKIDRSHRIDWRREGQPKARPIVDKGAKSLMIEGPYSYIRVYRL
jgi:hypothetical protein